MSPPDDYKQFTCPLCGGDRFYLVRHEIDDIEAIEMVANGQNANLVNLQRFLLPLVACCAGCTQFNESVTLIDHALKIGATRWERLILTDDTVDVEITKDEGETQ